MEWMGLLTGWSTAELMVGLLVFARLAAMIALLPSMGGVLNVRLRLAGAVVLSMLVAPMVISQSRSVPADTSWVVACIEQVFLGAFLGGAIHLWIGTFALVGRWIGALAGWGVDEPTGEGPPAAGTGQLYGWLGGVAFLAIDGPHMAIRALLDSFVSLPIAGEQIPWAWFGAAAANVLDQALWLALRIGSPILASLMVTAISIAAIQRAIPQFNLVRFQVAGNWLVLLIAMGLTIGLNVDHWSEQLEFLIGQWAQSTAEASQQVASRAY
jgi:flagellar biosynthetic protein FliR